MRLLVEVGEPAHDGASVSAARRDLERALTGSEIASELFVSETTVKTHVAHLLSKVSLRDRVQAVVFGYESGVVQPGENF